MIETKTRFLFWSVFQKLLVFCQAFFVKVRSGLRFFKDFRAHMNFHISISSKQKRQLEGCEFLKGHTDKVPEQTSDGKQLGFVVIVT